MSRNLAISLGVAVATATVLLGSTATASPNPSPTALLGMAASPDPSQITWGLHPSTDGEPDGRVSLRHALDGGSEVTDEVALTNFSEQAARSEERRVGEEGEGRGVAGREGKRRIGSEAGAAG